MIARISIYSDEIEDELLATATVNIDEELYAESDVIRMYRYVREEARRK